MYIPTLGGGERLALCLEALRRQTKAVSVVVADNGPGDGCTQLLQERFPEVTRIGFHGSNLGFGPALNRAVAAHGSGPLIFLNDDTVPNPDFVENLVQTWDRSCEMVAGVLLNSANPGIVDSAGIACDQTLTAWDYLTEEPVEVIEVADVPLGPTGGGALFDRHAFEKVGGFDERIFLYYEDLDLALRMRAAGMECRLARGARATHERSATLGRRAATKYYYTGFGRGYLLRKYGIVHHPILATKAFLSDVSAITGHLVLDRSLAGARGRVNGWKAGAGADKSTLPLEYLETASVLKHLKIRIARRGWQLPWLHHT